MTSIATYRASRELFTNLTLRELRSKYKRSFLGWLWSTVNPLATMAVYTVVFRLFMRIRPDIGQPSGLNVYALFLLCALLPWNFFQTGVMGCLGSLVANGNLIKKTYFPRDLIPASSIAAGFVSHAIEMGLLVLALVAFGNWRALPFLPFTILLMLVMAVFALGLGLLLSVLNVYFRDVEHFMSIFFLIWLYMSPIIYPLSLVPARYQTIVKINPLADAALCFRRVLYDGAYPGWLEFGYFVATAAVVFVLGLWVFNRLEGRLAEEL